MVESLRIFKFLAGLNVKFDEVWGRIIGQQPLLSQSEVFSAVHREESRRNVMLGKKPSTRQVKNLTWLGTEAVASHPPNNHEPVRENIV